MHSFLEHGKHVNIHNCDFSDKNLAMQILRNRFGENNVLYVSNYNKLNLKSLIKDISRLFDVPYEEVNAVTRIIEDEARRPILEEIGNDQKLYELTFEAAMRHSPTLRGYMERYPEVGAEINGLYRENKSIGKHAAAVLILDDAEKYMPVIRVGGDAQCPITEGITAQHLQAFGLIKIDVLGINTLKIIKRAIEFILEKEGKSHSMTDVWAWYNKNIHPDVMSKADPNVFDKVYRGGKWCSIFQFTQNKVKTFSKEANLSSLEEISQATSIQRPGPLGAGIDKKYIEAKLRGKLPEDEHPVIKEILGENFGYILFQEDFMALANKLAGFSLEETDKLRKLLMKPSAEMKGEILEERQKSRMRFIDGCVKNGVSQKRAEYLWDVEIIGFVSYSFNRSHSCVYSYISLQCAHLFTYHEEEWVRACLELDEDRESVINDISNIGYQVGEIDILKSDKSWKIEGKKCVPSLLSIKGIGEAAIDELMENRAEVVASALSGKDTIEPIQLFNEFFYETEEKVLKNGKVKSKKKWRWSKFNKRSVDALIKLEAFGSFGLVGRGCLFANYAHMHRAIIDNWTSREKDSFDLEQIAAKTDNTPWTKNEIIQIQTELLGTFDKTLLVSKDVLEALRECDISPLSDLSHDPKLIWFILTNVGPGTTAKGKPYYKLTIMDLDASEKKLNYFYGAPRDGWGINCVYYTTLHLNNGFVNVAKGNFLERL